MDNGKFLQVPGQAETQTDRYTASIDLSNACRHFYQTQLKAAQSMRSRCQRYPHTKSSDDSDRLPEDSHHGDSCSRSTDDNLRRPLHRNSIDEAMERLRTEVASLMEQDLSLMETLLTLNEAIEDLKLQRGYCYSGGSSCGSFTDLPLSHGSVSQTDPYGGQDNAVPADHHPAATIDTSPTPVLISPPSSSSITTATSSPSPVLISPPSSSSITTATSSPSPVLVLSSSLSSAASSSSSCHRKQSGVVYSHLRSEHAPYSSSSCVSGGRGGVDCETTNVNVCENHELGKACKTRKVIHGDQDSFDSGFHESVSEEEAHDSH